MPASRYYIRASIVSIGAFTLVVLPAFSVAALTVAATIAILCVYWTRTGLADVATALHHRETSTREATITELLTICRLSPDRQAQEFEIPSENLHA